MICIERVAIDAEPVRVFPEAWQKAQPLNRRLGLGFGRIDSDELDLVPVVVALVFVMNHKDCSKRLVQSPSPVRPKQGFPTGRDRVLMQGNDPAGRHASRSGWPPNSPRTLM